MNKANRFTFYEHLLRTNYWDKENLTMKAYDDSYHYAIRVVVLLKVMDYKDLEAIINSDLETMNNCKAAAAEGFKIL